MNEKALTFTPDTEKHVILGIIIFDVLIIAAIALTSPLIALAIVFAISLLVLFYLPRLGYIYFLLIWLPYESLVISQEGPYEFYRLTVLVLLMVLAWFKYWLSNNKIELPSKLVFYPIIAIYIWSGLTVLTSPYPMPALLAYLRLVTYLAIFILVYNLVESERDLRHIIVVAIIALIPTFIATFYQHQILGIGRARGFSHNPNTLSLYAVLAAALSLLWYRTGKKNLKHIIIFTFLFSISVWALLSSGARSALAAFMVFIIMYLFLAKRYKILLGLSVILILAAVEIYSHNSIFSNFGQNYRLYSGSTGRTLIWQTAFPLIMDHPIFGVGYGAVGKVIAASYIKASHPVIGFHLKTVLQNGLLHNGFIQKAAEIGIVGLLLYLTANFAFLAFLWKKMKILANPIVRASTTIALAFMVSRLVYSLVESSIHFGPLSTRAGILVMLTAILKVADLQGKIPPDVSPDSS